MPILEQKVPSEVKENWLANLLVGGPEETAGLAGPMPLVSKLKTLQLFPRVVQKELAQTFRQIPRVIFDFVKDVKLVPGKSGGEYFRRTIEMPKDIPLHIVYNVEPGVNMLQRQSVSGEKSLAHTMIHELAHATQDLHYKDFEALYKRAPQFFELQADAFTKHFYPSSYGGYYRYNVPHKAGTPEVYLKELLKSMGR